MLPRSGWFGTPAPTTTGHVSPDVVSDSRGECCGLPGLCESIAALNIPDVVQALGGDQPVSAYASVAHSGWFTSVEGSSGRQTLAPEQGGEAGRRCAFRG